MRAFLIALALTLSLSPEATAQLFAATRNFSDRQAITVNNLNNVLEITSFEFGNRTGGTSLHPAIELTVVNRASQAIVYYEIGFVRFDPINRRITAPPQLTARAGLAATIMNNNNWRPLPAGQASSIAEGYEIRGSLITTYTTIAYVQAVRLQDGTVFRTDPLEMRTLLARQFPQFAWDVVAEEEAPSSAIPAFSPSSLQ